MKQSEFNDIYELAQGADTIAALCGDQKERVQYVRDMAAVYYSRVGYELAKSKMWINRQYLKLSQTMTNKTAEAQAEQDYADSNEVTRRDLEYLRDGLDKLMNSCASHLKDLKV